LIKYRQALVKEIEKLKALLWEFGPNEWNHLTPEGVNDEFSLIEQGSALAIVATSEDEIVGFAVLIDGSVSPNYLRKYCYLKNMLFVGDVVVSSFHSGKGIATHLLMECLSEAQNKNADHVLIERHEENLASAGMMSKAGFSIVDTFNDPKKRTTGSKNSVILEFKIKEAN
jgi:ribosomal protein S18 acetylase RimI-like enzyme